MEVGDAVPEAIDAKKTLKDSIDPVIDGKSLSGKEKEVSETKETDDSSGSHDSGNEPDSESAWSTTDSRESSPDSRESSPASTESSPDSRESTPDSRGSLGSSLGDVPSHTDTDSSSPSFDAVPSHIDTDSSAPDSLDIPSYDETSSSDCSLRPGGSMASLLSDAGEKNTDVKPETIEEENITTPENRDDAGKSSSRETSPSSSSSSSSGLVDSSPSDDSNRDTTTTSSTTDESCGKTSDGATTDSGSRYDTVDSLDSRSSGELSLQSKSTSSVRSGSGRGSTEDFLTASESGHSSTSGSHDGGPTGVNRLQPGDRNSLTLYIPAQKPSDDIGDLPAVVFSSSQKDGKKPGKDGEDSIELNSVVPDKDGGKEKETGGDGGKFVDIPLEDGSPSSRFDASMNEEQNENLKEKYPYANVGFFGLFKFSDCKDKILMLVGSFGMMLVGMALPVNIIVYGGIVNKMIDNAIQDQLIESGALPNTTVRIETVWEAIKTRAVCSTCIGITVIFAGSIGMSFWKWTAHRQSQRIRKLFFQSLMRQSVGWYDTQKVGALSTSLADDIMAIHDGMGDKMAIGIMWLTQFVSGYVIGFIKGWKLALVVMAFMPLILVGGAVAASFVRKLSIMEVRAYSKAGAIAEEVLAAIRTVVAFGGEEKEGKRYAENLQDAKRLGTRKGVVLGICFGIVWSVIFIAFAVTFWYGYKLNRDGDKNYNGGNLIQVFITIMIGSLAIAQSGPNLEHFAKARASAAKVFHIITEGSAIDASSPTGAKPDKCYGNLRFVNAFFSYPTRKHVPVLSGLNLEIKMGQTLALVGPSGCGKSTIAQLIKRFYDPDQGRVLVDGIALTDLNVAWLRSNIGVVSQEPVLFSTTIAENIRYGREGVTHEEVISAAREANAHQFISNLPDKYDTLVGERGTQLSGGQKQRVAIARALVRNPRILLLDEATSALDNQSEALVQGALDKVSKGRTTIVIAHRLSTIRQADVIVGIRDGKVAEMGSHAQLMQREGLYYNLVTSQMSDKNDKGKTEDNSSVEDELAPQSPEFKERLNSVLSGSYKRSELKRTSSRWSKRSMQRQESHDPEWTKEDEAALEQDLEPATMSRILKMSSPEWLYILVGCLSASLVGMVHPAYGLLFSEALGSFAEVDEGVRTDVARNVALGVFAIGVVTGISNVVQQACFAKAGETLTYKLRSNAFSSIIRQEISWFDEPRNEVGALTARLATDASIVKGAAGSAIGTFIQAASTITFALIAAFCFGWKLAFLVLLFMPLLMADGFIQGLLTQGVFNANNDALEEGGRIANEAIMNIRTVASLGREETFINKFNAHFEELHRVSVRSAWLQGISYGCFQSVMFFCFASSMTFGGWLINEGQMEFISVIRVYGTITFAAQSLGRATSYAPDFQKAKMAAAKIFTVLDRKPKIDSSSPYGKKIDDYKGNLEVSGVKFRYPMRPDMKVLRGLKLTVSQGQTLALVGASGCGKSTIVQLLERFYDPHAGQLRFDGESSKELNLTWLRSQIGLVSQEPVLFDMTLRENIAYGDNSRDASMDEIIEAAKQANIHNFISQLPLGYDTFVGEKGAQLSGGQKQRVAIARALLRNPKILLLDEATSALDAESERVVQEALDYARMGRTCVIIAHRLSTIQDADMIAVIRAGAVVEIGTHQELMKARGHYCRLQQTQHKS